MGRNASYERVKLLFEGKKKKKLATSVENHHKLTSGHIIV